MPQANLVEMKMPMLSPDVIMPVNGNVRSTLGEYGEKLTGPLVFHERPALKGNQQFRRIRLDLPRRGTQISICAEIKQTGAPEKPAGSRW